MRGSTNSSYTVVAMGSRQDTEARSLEPEVNTDQLDDKAQEYIRYSVEGATNSLPYASEIWLRILIPPERPASVDSVV